MQAIIIDAGHGYGADGKTEDNGAHASGSQSATERELTVALGQNLMIAIASDPLLKSIPCYGVGINERLSLSQHISKVNTLSISSEAILLSLHINSGPATARGIEAWYPARGGPAKNLAQIMTESIALNTKFTLRNQTIRSSSDNRLGRLGILDDTFTTSCLLELGFITNDDDLKILTTNQDDIVKGLVAGIKKYLKINAPPSFPDIPVDSWYGEAVAKVFKAGIMGGFADGTFKPQQPITRAEMAVIVTRILKL